MNADEARNVLKKHSRPIYEEHVSYWPPGFVGQVRPYKGSLDEAHFLEVMETVGVLAQEISSDTIDRELVCDLWHLVWLPRIWAFHPDGKIQRGKLMSEREQHMLDDWLNRISEAVSYALSGHPYAIGEVMKRYRPPLPPEQEP